MDTMRKEWMEKDYYAVLGVDKGASDKDVKKAYRKLARASHPDNNPDDAGAEARFKEINEAYDVLSNADERKEYDHVREMGYFVGDPGGRQQYVRVEDLLGGRQGGDSAFDLFGGLGDLIGRGQQPRSTPGHDVTAEMHLSFHDALNGVTKELDVGGSRVKVKVPQGVSDGTRIRVKGKGGPGRNGGQSGDLYVRVRAADHPIFTRVGKRNLGIAVPITFTEAALGAVIDVPTLDGKSRIKIPAGTPNAKTFKVTGKGVERSKGTGDLLVTVEVVIPRNLSDQERAFLEEYQAEAAGDNPRAHLGV